MNMDDQLIEDIRTLLQALLPETQRNIIEPQIKAMNKGSKEARLKASLALLLFAGLLGGSVRVTPEYESLNVLSVTGVGRVSVRPDTMLVDVGVEARAPAL